jgi:cobalamin biosynthesis protein CobT
VLIVLSDGSPCTDWASESTANQSYTDRYRKLNAATKAAVDRVVKEGGVVSAIGINDDSVRQFYDDHIVIHDVTELPKESINMLSRNIFGGV